MKTRNARGNESGISHGATAAPVSPRDAVLAASSRNEQALQRAALAVSRGGGPHVYEELIAELAKILEVDVAFVAVFDDVGQTQMRTLAAWLDGRLLRNFSYVLSGTPCAQVVGRDFRYVEQGVCAEFAPDTIFAAKGMDCYAAYPLFAAGGESLGLLVTMNRAAMVDPALAESMLKIFAVRISAEIERGRGEEALRASAAQYRAMFDAWEDALVLRDAAFRIVDVNTTYEKFTGRKREEVLGIDRVIANPPGVDERVKALHGRALTGESIQLETQLLNVNGTQRDLELRGVPMRHQGEPHGFTSGATSAHESAPRPSERFSRPSFANRRKWRRLVS
jgi:PAS domain S-box-containing protein